MGPIAELVVLITGAISRLAAVGALAWRGLKRGLVAPVIDRIDELAATKEREHRDLDAHYDEAAARLERVHRDQHKLRRVFRSLLLILRHEEGSSGSGRGR
jgi:hypothetical protein